MQYEPWIDRDRVMIDMLKSIGIEKGKPFAPDQGTQAVLKDAIGEARAWLDNRYEGVFTTSFNEGRQWVLPALPGVSEGMMTGFANPDAYPVDGRGVAYSMAFFSAKHLGAGQYYLMTIRDKDRKPLDGNGTYRLNVPANAPVKLYWSATGMTGPRTHLSAASHGRAVPPTRQNCRRTPTGRCLFSSRRKRRLARSRTGCRPARMASSKSCSASMARRSRSSTNVGPAGHRAGRAQ